MGKLTGLCGRGLRFVRRHGMLSLYRKVKERRDRNRAERDYESWLLAQLPGEEETKRQRETEFAFAPLVSILVPAYETPEPFLRQLLDSLAESCPDNQFAQLSLSNVSPAMGTRFLQKSLVAVVFALALILVYIAFRFKNIGGLTGGAMAILALVNDVMVIFGTFVLMRAALDGNFIAALLTILGYSVNDTVVIYDRIRENRKLLGKKVSFGELVNQSLNQSLKRTLMTSVTTVTALAVMCVVSVLYGLDSIFTFAFPLMMGMISGVYTSLCVSTSAWVLWDGRKAKQKK